MRWMECVLDLTPAGADLAIARLAALGIEQFQTEDEAEFEAHMQKHRQAWDFIDDDLRDSMRGVCRVRFYLPHEVAAPETIAGLEASLSSLRAEFPEVLFGALRIDVRSVDEEDWAENWKRYYLPLPIGQRLLIQPEWQPLVNPECRVVFRNDPGVSFGTGSHETTRLCLEALDRHITGGEAVLDIGSGSGILSLCALLLGASRAQGLDIDPLAVSAATQNAARNGIDPSRFQFSLGNLLETPQLLTPARFDVVCANIVADVILALLPVVWPLLASGGVFITSGIIDTRRAEVADALVRAGFFLESEAELGGWCRITARRPASV